MTREHYIDAAKGISILLVVYWHCVGDRLAINEALIFLRMPLFFFVGGLFALKAMEMKWPDFLSTRALHLLWIYVVWCFILYTLTILPGMLLDGEASLSPILNMFTDPMRTIWFIYALLIAYIVCKLLYRFNKWLVLAVLLAAYTVATADGEWRDMAFANRIIRLLPFIWIAISFKDEIVGLVQAQHKWWPVTTAAFLAAAMLVYGSDLSAFSPITLALSGLGIFSILAMCYSLRTTKAITWLAWLGERSIYIYLIHRIFLAYILFAMKMVGIPSNALTHSVVFVVVAAASLWLGDRVLKGRLPFLFAPPRPVVGRLAGGRVT